MTTPNNPGFNWNWNFYNIATDITKDPTFTFPKLAVESNYLVTLIVTSDFGCNDAISYEVKIIDNTLLIPNIMIPNGDGVNDNFEIGGLLKGGGYTETQVIIYNRWGKKVYENNNYKNNFDGEGLSDGVYYVTIKAKGILGDLEHKGSLQILR